MQDHPDFHFCGVEETEDDDMIAYEKVRQFLIDHPELNSLFVISAGAYGAARAVLASRREDITMIVFDTIPTTIEMMKKGVIQAAIYQHPHQQGQRAMLIVFDYLVNGTGCAFCCTINDYLFDQQKAHPVPEGTGCAFCI